MLLIVCLIKKHVSLPWAFNYFPQYFSFSVAAAAGSAVEAHASGRADGGDREGGDCLDGLRQAGLEAKSYGKHGG